MAGADWWRLVTPSSAPAAGVTRFEIPPPGGATGGGDVEGTIRRIAQERGFADPDLLVATARQESGLNPRAVGDRGNSRGIFQENVRGRGAGLTAEQSFDPVAATGRAIDEFTAIRQRFPEVDRGTWAARAQRPADAAGYARSVNSLLGGAPPTTVAPPRASPETPSGGPDWWRLVAQPASRPPAASGVSVGPAEPGAAPGKQPGWLDLASAQLGKPYIWGSKGGRSDFSADAAGFDCSGFVAYVYRNALGVDLPAFTGSAYPKTQAVAPNEAQPGDLVFWNMGTPDPRRQHVAIYIGGGKVIQSGGQGDGVNIAPVSQMPGAEFRRAPAAAGALSRAPAPSSATPGTPDRPGAVWLQGTVAAAPAARTASAPADAPSWWSLV
jgi:cell wall-associated NlpC family hydrolase